MSEDLFRAARAYLELDPNPAHGVMIRRYLASEDLEALSRLLGAPLSFGTAGLRGAVGPGTSAMNEFTVRAFARALGDYVCTRVGRGRLVLGFDARPESESFARSICDELVSLGHEVCFLRPESPTPLIAFLARTRGADAAVAVTASHNPRGDAGIKVFDEQGIQINEPWDREVQERMGRSPDELLERFSRVREPVSRGRVDAPDEAEISAYFSWVRELAARIDPDADGSLRVAYSPLHGVGLAAVERVAREARVVVDVVPAQARPDGNFPTLPRPNPEEIGALDLLRSLMGEKSLDFGLANDPDADRLAVLVPGAESDALCQWTGDELGLVLGDAWLRASGIENALMVASVVSSPAIDVLAARRGARVARTLTGFKWICHRANDDSFAFAYEEALGYCFGLGPRRPVLDKDGIAAFAVISSLAHRLARESGATPGSALARRLAELSLEVGLWVNRAHSVRLETPELRLRAQQGQEALRGQPLEALLDWTVTRRLDYRTPAVAEKAGFPEEDLFTLELARGGRDRAVIHLRPSGTEPKLKFYCHLSSHLERVEFYESERSRLHADAGRIVSFIEERLGLRAPSPE